MRTWANQMTDACPQGISTETLSAWRDATLGASDADFVARHAPTCRACADRLALFDAIEDALRQQRTPAPRASLWGEVYARIADDQRGERADPRHDSIDVAGYPTEYATAHDGGGTAGGPVGLPPTARQPRQARRPARDAGGRTPREGQRLRRRWGAVGAATAAALVAALLIALLASRLATHSNGGQPTPTAHTPVSSVTATSTTSATSDVLPAGWQNLPALANGPTQPVIAPSDPQVVYFAGGGTTVKGQAPTYTLARSDDGGATIHHLPFPTLNGQTIDTYAPLVLNVVVNPLNPQTVYLYTQIEVAACPANFAPLAMRRVSLDAGLGARRGARGEAPLAGNVCQPEFVSTDGGESWGLLNLPAKGLLGITSPDGNRAERAIQIQGTRLYGTVSDVMLAASGVPVGGRLVVSEDGGVTWTLVDAPIAAQGLVAYDFAATPSGSTVFVVSENPQTVQLPTLNADSHLWRSDDAGATWTELGPIPNASVAGGSISGMAATVAASGQPILYLDPASDNTGKTLPVEASADGGQSWQSAPAVGSLNGIQLLGVTASNQIVMLFDDGAYRAWAVGDTSWTTVAPSLGSSFSDTSYFIGAAAARSAGKVALYAIGQFNGITIVARYTLP